MKEGNYMRLIKKLLFTLFMSIAILTSTTTPFINKPVVVQAATIRISQKTLTLNMNDTKKLRIIGTTKKITWTSSNKAVASVSKTGKVTAKTAGDTIITAKVNGQKYTCTVSVTDAVSSATKKG